MSLNSSLALVLLSCGIVSKVRSEENLKLTSVVGLAAINLCRTSVDIPGSRV